MNATRSRVLSALDLPQDVLEVPQWGVTLKLQCMSAIDASNFAAYSEDVDPLNAMVRLITQTVVADDGQPLFAEGDEVGLMKKNVNVLRLVFDACLRVNGMTSDDAKDAEKNSGGERGSVTSLRSRAN